MVKYYSRDLTSTRTNIEEFDFNIINELKTLEKEEIIGKDLKTKGLNLLYGVGRGSNIEPRLIISKHVVKENEPFVALIGKGVLFDSGGVNLKTNMSSIR